MCIYHTTATHGLNIVSIGNLFYKLHERALCSVQSSHGLSKGNLCRLSGSYTHVQSRFVCLQVDSDVMISIIVTVTV